jgi:hypothetical protein
MQSVIDLMGVIARTDAATPDTKRRATFLATMLDPSVGPNAKAAAMAERIRDFCDDTLEKFGRKPTN